MKKSFVYHIILFLLFLVISIDSLADRKPHPRYKGVVVVKPVRPHIRVFKPVHLNPSVVWVEGHYNWSKRKHRYIWVKVHLTKKRKVKIKVHGHL